MNTHTHAPWLIRKRDEKFKLPNGTEISNPFAYEVFSGEPETINVVCRLGLVSAGPDAIEANARLIAAAPELYEFIQQVAIGNSEYDALQTAARKLIAKVES